jgi:choline dehydrogenase-like flavoprotein
MSSSSTPFDASHDYLIIGGGSAGCALAGRLSEDASLSVAVIEAGGSGDSWVVNTPTAGVFMIPTKLNNWAFETVPQAGLNGRRGYQPRGKTLGGSSAINAMVYIRGERSDYDHWASLGNSGWSFDELLPFFIKSECNDSFGAPLHGQSGPLKVSQLRTDNPFQQRWLAAARERGLPITDDFNGASQEGVGIYQVTQHNGERWSAARGYLRPHMSPNTNARKNLSVMTHTKVQRILFDGKRAVGIEVNQGGQVKRLQARREVILSAGALLSPQLLMLSGVGDAAALQQLGLPVVHHLPGVGANLQDHPDYTFGYLTDSLDAVGISLKGGMRTLREIGRYRRERRGMITSNFAEGGGFLKTRPELAVPNVQLHFVVALVKNHARDLGLGHGLSCHVCLLRPASRGSVKLASREVGAAPLIDPAFLQDAGDVQQLIEGFRLTRELMRAPAMKAHWTHEAWGSNANTDAEIEALLRQRVDTVYHPVGSCKMGIDAMAVVDPQLRVHGLEGLRVVDASIMPTLIGGNTNAPSMMIAEKAAQMIRAGLAESVAARQQDAVAA